MNESAHVYSYSFSHCPIVLTKVWVQLRHKEVKCVCAHRNHSVRCGTFWLTCCGRAHGAKICVDSLKLCVFKKIILKHQMKCKLNDEVCLVRWLKNITRPVSLCILSAILLHIYIHVKWNSHFIRGLSQLCWEMERDMEREASRNENRSDRGHCSFWNAWLAAWPLASWLSICEGQSLHWADFRGQEICWVKMTDVWNELNMNWEWIETIWNTKLTSDDLCHWKVTGNCGKLWYQDVAHLGIFLWW